MRMPTTFTHSDLSPTVPLERHDDALMSFRRVLANLASSIDHNLQGTIEDIDVEFLHELRVAVRRTRSVLSQGKGVLPAEVRDRYRPDFGWLGQVTGPARDLDVYVLGWESYVAPLRLADSSSLDWVRAELENRRQAAYVELATVLRGDACRDLLDSWRRWLVDPDVVAAAGERIGPVIAKRIAKAQKKVLTHGRAISPASPPERLHDLRKDTKKLRYLFECFGSLFLNRPGLLGGSRPWKRGWSMATTGARRRPQKYPDELRERAVRMVLEIREETGERHGTITRVARELGVGAESLRHWVNRAEVDSGRRPGTSTADAQRIAQLERENKELRRANDILKAASVFFATELDGRSKR